MSYIDIMVLLLTGIWAYITLIVLPQKRKSIWDKIVGFVSILGIYTAVLFVQNYPIFGMPVAATIEMLGSLVLVGIFTKGMIWKNFVIMYLTTQFSNVFLALITLVSPSINQLYSVLVFKDGKIEIATYVLLLVVESIITFLVEMAICKILKPDILSRRKVYMMMTVVVILISVVGSSLNREVVKGLSGNEKQSLYVFLAIFVIVWLVALNFIGYIYGLSEKKRIKKRKELLNKLSQDTYDHYNALAKTNQELHNFFEGVRNRSRVVDEKKIYADYVNQLGELVQEKYDFSLSGCLAVDSILYEYSCKAKKQGIGFSVIVEPFYNLPISEQNMAAMIECLMEKAFAGTRKMSCITMDVRMRNGMLIMIFSVLRNARAKNHSWNIELVEDLVEMHNGVVHITSEKDEEVVSLFIPNTETEIDKSYARLNQS